MRFPEESRQRIFRVRRCKLIGELAVEESDLDYP